jgi:hypothetical protein
MTRTTHSPCDFGRVRTNSTCNGTTFVHRARTNHSQAHDCNPIVSSPPALAALEWRCHAPQHVSDALRCSTAAPSFVPTPDPSYYPTTPSPTTLSQMTLSPVSTGTPTTLSPTPNPTTLVPTLLGATLAPTAMPTTATPTTAMPR